MGLRERYDALYDTLTSFDLTNNVSKFTIGQLDNLSALIHNRDLTGASPRFRAYAAAVSRHSDTLLMLPQDATVTDFVTAMLYVRSQDRPPEGRWALSNLPSNASRALARSMPRALNSAPSARRPRKGPRKQ